MVALKNVISFQRNVFLAAFTRANAPYFSYRVVLEDPSLVLVLSCWCKK